MGRRAFSLFLLFTRYSVLVAETSTKEEETHQYTITPKISQVNEGSWFSVTCKTNSSNGLNLLQWSVRRGDEEYRKAMDWNRNETIKGLIYSITNSTQQLFSVLNATTAIEGQLDARIKYTFYCSETWDISSQAEATVTIHPADYRVRDGLVGAGIAVLVLSISVSVFIFWRKRKLRAALALVSDFCRFLFSSNHSSSVVTYIF